MIIDDPLVNECWDNLKPFKPKAKFTYRQRRQMETLLVRQYMFYT